MNKILYKTLDLLFPENIYCSCCGDVINKSRVHGLCDNCVANLAWIIKNPFQNKLEGFFFDDVISLTKYDGYAQMIMHNLKLHSKPYIARGIGKLMGELLNSYFDDKLILTPVPMYNGKKLLRGYNQAALLAKYASVESDNVLYEDLLIKDKSTDSMRMAKGDERYTTLDSSIIINPARVHLVENRDIVLVDDVITTGNTANCCTKILKDAGANHVYILTFAAVDYKGKIEET